jgi:DMSO/TMAO reductase YedYZ molybdopterin-dependent catalytic subunit
MTSRRVGVLIGWLSAGVALAAAQLVAAFVSPNASPMVAVGEAVIDRVPPGVKDWAISTFGRHDKLALLIGIGAVLAILAAALGIASVRRPTVAYAGLIAFGAVGVLTAVTRPNADKLAVLPSLAAVAAGIGTFEVLSRTERSEPEFDFDRRRFVLAGGALAVFAIAAASFSRVVGAASRRATASRALFRLPAATDAPKVPSGVDLKVPGLSSFYTSNADFYRVDTALIVPKLRTEDWHLKIHGMVDKEIEMDINDLLARPIVERDITLTCVSNKVGDQLVGNARWTGVLLKPILEEARPHAKADQVVTRSSDGFTCGTPTKAVMDGRDAMLAFGMNGVPLPLEHGFPVRMLVPGLYGYVSATKWIVDMELTTFDAFDAYWVERGWDQKAPIKTQSRIDTPRDGRRIARGEIPIAGVAWAQHKGIAKVEVRIDDGPWRAAELSAEDTPDTWRLWVYRWNGRPGSHTIRVRATDKTGYTQTGHESPPPPNGATGWHTINVAVV